LILIADTLSAYHTPDGDDYEVNYRWITELGWQHIILECQIMSDSVKVSRA